MVGFPCPGDFQRLPRGKPQWARPGISQIRRDQRSAMSAKLFSWFPCVAASVLGDDAVGFHPGFRIVWAYQNGGGWGEGTLEAGKGGRRQRGISLTICYYLLPPALFSTSAPFPSSVQPYNFGDFAVDAVVTAPLTSGSGSGRFFDARSGGSFHDLSAGGLDTGRQNCICSVPCCLCRAGLGRGDAVDFGGSHNGNVFGNDR